MKPLRLTLTIELPPDGSPERDQVMRMTLSELLGIDVPPARSAPVPASRPDPPVRPHREPDPADDDEAAGVQRDDNRPMTGNQLLGWIGDQPDPRGALKRRSARQEPRVRLADQNLESGPGREGLWRADVRHMGREGGTVSPFEISMIVTRRLDGWGQQLIDSGATPILLLGLTTRGKAVACTCEDVSDREVERILEDTLASLRRQRSKPR